MAVIKNIALRIRYDGAAYHGWQMQKDLPTVQETLESALARVCGHPVKVTGCGRTDAGVHAERYCVNFHSDCRVPLERLPLAVNTLLPVDVVVQEACQAPEEFCAIRSCIQKEYTYRILNARIRDPFLAGRVCFYPAPLDLDRMRAAGEAFVGTHDFAAVRSVGTETKTTVRTVKWCDTTLEEGLVTVRVCADGFLYNMARAIVGTMVYAAHGKINPEEIPALLEKGDRRLTGPTMPPQGLAMTRLWYPGEVGEMMKR